MIIHFIISQENIQIFINNFRMNYHCFTLGLDVVIFEFLKTRRIILLNSVIFSSLSIKFTTVYK